MMHNDIREEIRELGRIQDSLVVLFDVFGGPLSPSVAEQEYRKLSAHPLLVRMQQISENLQRECEKK